MLNSPRNITYFVDWLLNTKRKTSGFHEYVNEIYDCQIHSNFCSLYGHLDGTDSLSVGIAEVEFIRIIDTSISRGSATIYRTIPIRPGLTFVQKPGFLLALFSGEFILGGGCYRK